MNVLVQIDEQVRERADAVVVVRGDWPCRKGCDDCCRSLAAGPRVSRGEWERLTAAIDALPPAVREQVCERARSRGRVCPLLDSDSGACLVYDARPVACRAYGFYAERGLVLGCARIEAIARAEPDVMWGSWAAVERSMDELGEARDLADWLD